jgi:5'-nucleotidase
MKDMMNCFPFEDPVVVLRVNGRALLDALENSVSLVPALEGRSPQVSNIRFEYSIRRPSGSRVVRAEVNRSPLEESRFYTIATRGYMAHGKDGFDSLLARSEGGRAEELVSEENGILISTMLRQYFLSLKILGRWRQWASLHKHWDDVHSKLHRDHDIVESSQSEIASMLRNRPRRSGSEVAQTDGALSASTQKRATIASQHGGRFKSLEKNEEYQTQGHDMIDSDSDGSVILDDPAPLSVATHPLICKNNRSVDDSMTHNESDRLYYLARQYGKRWMALAGVAREEVGMVDEHRSLDIPRWTRGISPKVEGRIIQVTE